MDKKSAAIDTSLNQIFYLFKGVNSEDFRMLEIGFRHFAEHVVGMSVMKLMPSFEALLVESKAGGRDDLRMSARGDKETILQVRDALGKWFGVSWKDREPLHHSDKDESAKVIDFTFYKIDAERWDYPYPERIGFANLVIMNGRIRPFGVATLEEFGNMGDALRSFATAAKLPLPPVDPETLNGPGFMTVSMHNDALALDGGVIGKTCREIAISASKRAAVLGMEWAAELMPSVAAGLKAEGVLWNDKALQFNDLDNTVSILPPGPGGGISIIHRNSSYISDYRTYVLTSHGTGRLSLYALKDGTDDLQKVKTAICDDKDGFKPIAVLRDGVVKMLRPFDTTGIIDAMTHGLKSTHEIVVKGDRYDADYVDDFSVFDTRHSEDIENDDASPSL